MPVYQWVGTNRKNETRKGEMEAANEAAPGTAPGTEYTCPMHPEVVQDHPGSCPKCGMNLEIKGVPVKVAKNLFTCPMHPEIKQEHPGNCPICGMALEPLAVNIEVEEENEELKDMSRRFWIGAALSFPVFILSMIADLMPAWLPFGITMQIVQWIGFILSTPVVWWGGWPFFVRGWQSIKTWNLNMFTLIGLGTGVAYGYSLIAVLFPDRFPGQQRPGYFIHRLTGLSNRNDPSCTDRR